MSAIMKIGEYVQSGHTISRYPEYIQSSCRCESLNRREKQSTVDPSPLLLIPRSYMLDSHQ